MSNQYKYLPSIYDVQYLVSKSNSQTPKTTHKASNSTQNVDDSGEGSLCSRAFDSIRLSGWL